VHRSTRVQPTTITFGWRGKTALSLPPILVFAFWIYSGVFNFGAAALGIGLPMLWAIGWWLKQVWVAGPDERSRSDVHQDIDTTSAPPLRPDLAKAHPGLVFLYTDPPQPQ
jgi:hypothetical protein